VRLELPLAVAPALVNGFFVAGEFALAGSRVTPEAESEPSVESKCDRFG
jgi:hypothetical protein